MRRVKIGDQFRVTTSFGAEYDGKKVQTGKVVWLDPRGRFAVLEFDGVAGKPRECFHLGELVSA